VSLRRRLSCSLSASLASYSVRLVFALWAASFILPLASIALLLPGRVRVRGIVFRSPLVGGARHVLDDNAALGTGTFHLGEVHA
jgi:hypothetical protein